MDIKNAQRLVKFLKKLHHKKFWMGEYMNTCGTVGCIAGWCCVLSGAYNKGSDGKLIHFFDNARKFLGLECSDATNLFLGHWHSSCDGDTPFSKRISRITKQDAIDHLEELIKDAEFPISRF